MRVSFHLQQAKLAFEKSDLDLARKFYEAALSIDSKCSEALGWLGTLEARQGNLDRSKNLLLAAIELDKKNFTFLTNYASVLQEISDYSGALEVYLEALTQRRDAIVLSGIAACYRNMNQSLKALDFNNQAVRLNPRSEFAWIQKGLSLDALERYEESLSCYLKATELNPRNSDAWNKRGAALTQLKRPKDALFCFNRSLECQAKSQEAWNNRGVALHSLGLYIEAIDSYKKSLSQDSESAETWYNLAHSLAGIRRDDEALNCYNRALLLDPSNAEIYFDKSMTLLRNGDFTEGLNLYEWRWKWKRFKNPQIHCSKPLWLGTEDLSDKIILLHAEQGLGDTIQYFRYAIMVAEMASRTYIEVPEPLVSLFRKSYPMLRISARGTLTHEFDFQCPFMSLPLAFRTTVDSIPYSRAYLKPDSNLCKSWHRLINSLKKPKIGIVWRGNPNHDNDNNRSVSFDIFSELLTNDFSWVVLQKDLRKDEINFFKNIEASLVGDNLADFNETAAVLSLLDLVVTVDTSVAHLAGALGKPVWILIPYVPDFRWLWDRSDSPWYPSAKLFRQHAPGNWIEVVIDVVNELRCGGSNFFAGQ